MSRLSSGKHSVLVPGQRLERYELLCPVAQGGMAWVWLARVLGKPGSEKLVAIKTILPEFAADARFQTMFLDEAHIASGIRHANVAQILDLGESRKALYLVMEWVDGESLMRLGQALDEKDVDLPNGVLLRVIADACGGLHAAHELADKRGNPLGVVHRDVSPDNILVDARGNAKVIDFGVAKARDRLSSISSSGLIKGKLEYMAPEQALGNTIDRRADVFGIGAVLYSLLARHFPFEGKNHVEIVQRMVSGAKPAPLPDSVPNPIASLIMKSIAVDPGQRFETALAQQKAIERAMVDAGCVTSNAEVARFFASALPERAAERRESVETALAAASRRSIPSSLLDAEAPHVALRSAATQPELEARPAIHPGPRTPTQKVPIQVPERPPPGTSLSTPGPMRVSSHSFAEGRPEVAPEKKRSLALDGGEARTRLLAKSIAEKYATHVASRVVLARVAWRKDHDETEASRWLAEIERPEIFAGASIAEKIETKTLRGAIHLAHGRNAEARAAFESATEISSVDVASTDAEVGLGDVDMASGDYAKAVAHYKAALDLAPDDATAKSGVERAQAKLKVP